jgi:hypothetical protein
VDVGENPLCAWLFGEFLKGQCGVSVGSPGAHLGRDPNGLHDLLVAVTFPAGESGVAFNAVGTLGGPTLSVR